MMNAEDLTKETISWMDEKDEIWEGQRGTKKVYFRFTLVVGRLDPPSYHY